MLIIFAALSPVYAEVVYLDELKSAGDPGAVVFKNYSGPHTRIDSIEEIRGIGRYLGRNIGTSSGEFSFFGKYRVIHAVSEEKTELLNADVFILEESASVDHITNLRRIIAGFLEEAYDYTPERADLLAEFITVYNAVYRQNIDYFSGIYNEEVMKHVDKASAGLALSYDEWPGRTKMVIPLTPEAGTGVLADLDTDILTDSDVIEQLRTEDDMGLEQRRDMVDLKDDEVLEQRRDLEQKQDELAERQQEIEDREQQLAGQEQALDREKPEDAQDLERIEEEKAELEKQKDALAEEEAVLQAEEARIEEREDRIVEEREAISEDQMTVIEREQQEEQSAPASAPRTGQGRQIAFLRLEEVSGSLSGRLLLIDPANGKILKRSDLDSIRIRGYKYIGKEIISVAGGSGGERVVSLVAINPETLEVVRTGTAEVYMDSAVVESGGKYYAAVKDGSDWKAGIFDRDFKLNMISATAIFPATEFILNSGDVILQNSRGDIVTLSPEDFIEYEE